MTTASTVRAARELLTGPDAWFPDSFAARARDGRDVPPRSREAVRWGILAALVAVTGSEDDRRAEIDAIKAAAGKPKFLCDWEAEPGRTQAEVLDALDRAAAAADDPYGYRGAA